MNQQHISGCLIGMALGDALGAETEFLNIKGILEKFPPYGPQAPEGNPALVTDDTQMAIAVGEAIIAAPKPLEPNSLAQEFRRTFLAWYNDPENNRAPGNTCLTACEEMLEGKSWLEASQISSKGCGANMRVMPVGVLEVDTTTRAGIAQLQAAMTHGHPTGLAAADFNRLRDCGFGQWRHAHDLPKRVRDYALSQREVYHANWLGELWYKAFMLPTPQAYIAHGWDECLGVLDRLDMALEKIDRESDPCLTTGAGWVAEQAFTTALFCFLMYPDDPIAVIRRAAVTSGDSDSIACIAGAFAGAYHGIGAWPADWVERIEYRDRILGMAENLTK